ncbi:MAG TPA: tetratricopeptide repeat protein [Steroidobacteraceae bacterium]|nr:tetratricopeptide repeat protein [Steroidobacteraceae bacterium]
MQPRSDADAMKRARIALGVALASLAVATTYWLVRDAPRDEARKAGRRGSTDAQYVGSERCESCHEAQARAWHGSQHQRAMQVASDETVLGDFGERSFTYGGVTSRFFRRDGKYYVHTDGPDGTLADFEVRYTFGVYPLQQYLLELPGGRLQALSVAWDARPADAGGQRWFHLYPDEKIDHRDELHWTRRQQNWNFMCADCHSTNVEKRYDATTDAYATTWSEISVGCEACHGPGSAHLAWTERRGDDPARGLTVRLDERNGVAWTLDPETAQPRRSVARTSQREIDVCARCHARRSHVAEGYRAGAPFTDHYLPLLVEPSLYHADGQQRDEVFVWGSWLQSRMHLAGVTCSDCHDPHTQQLRAPGNAVCTQCHVPAKYDARSHHHHPERSLGAQCVECHMPRATYMVIDPRRDHSMRVPRPDQSVALGVPNACSQCHRESDAAWAAAQVRSWLGRDARGVETFATAFDAAEQSAPGAAADLARIASDIAQPAIVRASALRRLGGLGAYDAATVQRAVADADALVRLAAAGVGAGVPPGGRDALVPLLDDPRRAVRVEAARVLAETRDALPPEALAAWQRAADEYVATLHYNADRPESNVALGGFHAVLGQAAQAEAAFAAALRLDPGFEPAYVNAADVLRAQGRDAEAVALLERGLQHAPQGASIHHALGLAQVRLQQTASALGSLRRARDLAPDVPRYTYVYAVALHSTGRPGAAIELLEQAVRRWPTDRAIGLALASYQAGAGRREAARRTASTLLERFPDDPEVEALAAQLR